MRLHRLGFAVPSLALALSLFLLFRPIPALAQETAEELYQAGLYQEEVQGNLQRAIDLFGRILIRFPGSRGVGARAQLHIGLCYEKLGQQEAQQAYRRVIADFPEHAAEVAMARDRLAEIQQSAAELNPEPTFRKIEIASKPQNGVLSPDGHQLAFVADGGLWVVPVQGEAGPDIAGEPVRVRSLPSAWDYWSQLAWSAGGEWIAVNGGGDEENEVFVLSVSGEEVRTVEMPERGGHAWSYRLSLSPDGQRLAFSALDSDDGLESESTGRFIYTMPTRGGDTRKMASVPGRLPAYSPDGELIAFVGYERAEGGEDDVDGDLWLVPSEGGSPVRLTDVDGRLRGPVWSPDGQHIAAHFEPLAGNDSDEIWVFTLSPDRSSAGDPARIVLPRLSDHILSGWTPGNELGVFIKSEKREALYTVSASGGRAVQITPEGGVYYPRWSPDGQRIYFRTFIGGKDTGRLTDLLEGHESTVYVPARGGEVVEVPAQIELADLGIVIPGGGFDISPDGNRIVISAAQLPSDREDGLDLWTVPLDGGSPLRLTMDTSGESWPCWSPDGRWIAFKDETEQDDNGGSVAIYLVPAGGGDARQVTLEGAGVGDGPIAFSPDGTRIAYLSGNSIKTVSVRDGRSEVLVEGVQPNRYSQLAYSPDGSRIAHSTGGKIWITSLGTGVTEELQTGLPETAELTGFSWSPDGERIVFQAELGGESEFWLISDFLPKEVER